MIIYPIIELLDVCHSIISLSLLGFLHSSPLVHMQLPYICLYTSEALSGFRQLTSTAIISDGKYLHSAF
jgi:hypothetical protein